MASLPKTSGSALPPRTSARLERASAIRRTLKRTGWNQPSLPAGRSPARLNTAATYSAALRCSGLPVSRPRMESSARAVT